MYALESYRWPGNVRELRNVVERAVYRWDDEQHAIGHIVFDPFESAWAPGVSCADPPSPAPVKAATAEIADLRAAVDSHERDLVSAALDRHRWNQRRTASALGLSYDQLRHCLKKHGLTAPSARA